MCSIYIVYACSSCIIIACVIMLVGADGPAALVQWERSRVDKPVVTIVYLFPFGDLVLAIAN